VAATHLATPTTPACRTLQAGPLKLQFDTASGAVRTICLGEHEVLHGIYVAVRDRNWATVIPVLSALTHQDAEGGFSVSFTADCRQDPIHFVWTGQLTGRSDGTLQFAMKGQAQKSFLRNRIGFCVLHPIGPCAGLPCVVERTDGTVEHSRFPSSIASHQPFLNLRAISHEVTQGVRARVEFKGDVFEMEDQRNWSDASFKTYCTPLALPFPVAIAAGTEVSQVVTLRLHGDERPRITPLSQAQTVPALRLGRPVRLPRLGLGVASHDRPLTKREIGRLRSLRLDHLRIDVVPSSSSSLERLRRAANEARAMETSLHVAILLADDPASELGQLRDAAATLPAPVSAWLAFHVREHTTPPGGIELAKDFLLPVTPHAVFGAGTNANFAELNRRRPAHHAADLVCFSVNPQVHAFDDASLVETLEIQPQLVAGARWLAGDLPVAVTPITLKPRFNAVASVSEDAPPGQLPPQIDSRQPGCFAAGWTLGSIAALAAAGAASATYYETTGWRGIMESHSGSPWPNELAVPPGSVFPVWHLLADLAEWGPGEPWWWVLDTGCPLEIAGIAAGQPPRVMLVANLTAEPRVVDLPATFAARELAVRTLDEASRAEAALSPERYRASLVRVKNPGRVTLAPHALVRMELVREEVGA